MGLISWRNGTSLRYFNTYMYLSYRHWSSNRWINHSSWFSITCNYGWWTKMDVWWLEKEWSSFELVSLCNLQLRVPHPTLVGQSLLIHTTYHWHFAWNMSICSYASSSLVQIILALSWMWWCNRSSRSWNSCRWELKHMTVIRSKNSTSRRHTCGQSMISWHMVFSLDGAFMEIWLVPYAAKILIVFVLTSGRKICYFDCHRCFLPPDHTSRLQRNAFRKDTIVEKGPPRHRAGQEIIEELNNLKISNGGEEFEGYEKEHN
jgi:hypothetical protein